MFVHVCICRLSHVCLNLQAKRPYTAAQVVALRGHLRTSYASGKFIDDNLTKVYHSVSSTCESVVHMFNNFLSCTFILCEKSVHYVDQMRTLSLCPLVLIVFLYVSPCRCAGKEAVADSQA
jgi:isocitrate lyase